MLKINLKNVKKYYGEKLILDIEDFKVNTGDRIGIVGVNGVGKTTLLRIISGQEEVEEGVVIVKEDIKNRYISQLEDSKIKNINGKFASIFNISSHWHENMSGGEKTKFKIAAALEEEGTLLLADEPTSNLDIESIDMVTKLIKEHLDTYLIISHDRIFLDETCNKILEIEDGKLKIYSGNYSDYAKLKKEEINRENFEYEEYTKEKSRLANLKKNVEEKSSKVRRTPKRMGNSEARLHRMGGQGSKKNLDSFAKAVETRIEHLNVKEKPKEEEIIKIEILESSKPYSKILISGNNINKSFGENIVFEKANCSIYNGKKVALIGKNGRGKTTLINMILNEEQINISKNVKIGYFSQTMNILNESQTILENVMNNSVHDENFARLILARLLFKRDRVYEKIETLSGGEKVKVSFAKIILEDINFLILDEPTNYLDINSLEVIEELLKNYNGSLLIVSHDRKFIENIADELLIIENKKIREFKGKYSEYLEFKNKPKLNREEKNIVEKKMLLKTETSALLSRISVEDNEKLKNELLNNYNEKLKELKDLEK